VKKLSKQNNTLKLITPALILGLICLIAGTSLGFVNSLTKKSITNQTLKAEEAIRKTVLVNADNFEEIKSLKNKSAGKNTIQNAYIGKKQGEIVGYVFNITTKGFGGDMAVTIGLNSKGKILKVELGNNNETPGLGSKAKDNSFKQQYKNKSSSSKFVIIKKSPAKENEIQAISGATITSTAVTSAVQTACDEYNKLK